jgi:hypothetical protein
MAKGYLFRGNPVSFEEAFPEIETSRLREQKEILHKGIMFS